jgi:hypothetical protein
MVFDGNTAPVHAGALKYYKESGLYEKALRQQELPLEATAGEAAAAVTEAIESVEPEEAADAIKATAKDAVNKVLSTEE